MNTKLDKRSAFKTFSGIVKIVDGFQIFTIFAKKSISKMFDWVLNTSLGTFPKLLYRLL